MNLLFAALLLLTPSVVFLVYLVLSYRQQQALLDRLMAKNLADYKDQTQPAAQNTLAAEAEADDTLPIEDAEAEILKEDHEE